MANKSQNNPVDWARSQQAAEQTQAERALQEGVVGLRDFIAPASAEFSSSHFRLGTKYLRSAYVFGYPREVYTGWLGSLINLPEILDIALYIYPVNTEIILDNLRKKVSQLEAGIMVDDQRGRVRDPAKQSQIIDAEEMRTKLQVGEERFFRLGFYYTVYANSLSDLDVIHRRVDTLLRQKLVYSKPASAQQEEIFTSVLPQATDKLLVRRNMNTGAMGTTFPFTSADLTQDKGILYGINMHNSGLVIFDRFSLENNNSVVFATSGAGKSFAVKLEILRLMMLGVQVMVIDPENEYERLCEAVGGSYVKLSLNSPARINPFDLSPVANTDDSEEDALRNNLVSLHGLFRLMMGGAQVQLAGGQAVATPVLTPSEEADLDDALTQTYTKSGITSDPLTHNSPPPTVLHFYDVLQHMGGSGPKLAQRLRKYTTGTFAGIFSQASNISLDNQLVVFNIRDLEDELRPVAMYIALHYIWNRTKQDKRRRILVVDEAWQLMKYEDSANFMFGLTKRARKYNLGITTITQDVEDFTSSRHGRAIIANSSMQLFLKQSPTAADMLADLFKLTSEERKRLSQFPVGQGLFFAGRNHVHVQILASPTEQELITTEPDQLASLQQTNQSATPEAGPGDPRPESAAAAPEPIPPVAETPPAEEVMTPGQTAQGSDSTNTQGAR